MRVFAIVILVLFSFCGYSQTTISIDTSIVRDVDIVPQFKGGIRGFQQFLTKTIDIQEAIYELDSAQYVKYGARQTAILEFIVCEDGEVCEIEIVNKNKISPAFAEEALRVMKRSPKWIPGLKNGKAVRTRFRQPITAVLEQ